MPSSADDQPEASEGPVDPRRHEAVREATGWMVSLVLHAAACIALALLTLPPLPLSETLSLLGEPAPAEQIDDALDLTEAVLDLSAEELDQPLTTSALDAALAPPAPTAPAVAPAPAVDLASLLATSALVSPTDAALSEIVGSGTDGRTQAGRAALVAAKGGSPASEAAVARGLKWLIEHQNRDGTWSLIHTAGACRGRCRNPSNVGGEDPFGESITSATGLALLPFLGAGQTHESGRYRKQIRGGLEALVRLGQPEEDRPGLSWRDSGRLYSHAICTIVLCEAYGLTGDPGLRAPAEAAVAYLVYAQDPQGGGWRYTPQQAGDTSVTGWQIMALKSASLAGIDVPGRSAKRASAFLDSASAADGSRYGYLPRDGDADYGGTATMSAVGLLCRMYLGWDQNDARLARGVQRLADAGPNLENFYRNYYASQVIFHQTGGAGPTWRKWNESMRDQLVDLQETRGHERGSWWIEGPHNDRGGRLYATSLATMTLEVYYRYLPIYRAEAVELEFPD